jgi:acetyl-CoA carboxylase carboxyl transferase subunit beta
MAEGLWTKCPTCGAITYTKELVRNLMICPKCSFHFRLRATERIEQLCDRRSFEPLFEDLRSNDPISFKAKDRYRDKLKKAEKVTKETEAVKVGRARVNGRRIVIGVFDIHFIGGSMGIVVGERLTRIFEIGAKEGLPVVVVSASGGARMQEGFYSLMQMAKVTAALARLSEAGYPYISILSDPTTGGVAASFAMLGDIIITEPGAVIGFAGRRVIEQTIRKKLPDGFQNAEALLERGMVDIVVPREELKDTLFKILNHITPPGRDISTKRV